MSSTSAPNRRSFLACRAALAAVPAVSALVGGALAEPAFADTVPADDTLPDYAPIPPSALGPAVNASDNAQRSPARFRAELSLSGCSSPSNSRRAAKARRNNGSAARGSPRAC